MNRNPYARNPRGYYANIKKETVGKKKNKIIFKKPNVSSKLTRGKTNTVQTLANGVIV